MVRNEPVQGRRFEVWDAHGQGISPLVIREVEMKKTLALLHLLCGTEEEMKNTLAFLSIASLT